MTMYGLSNPTLAFLRVEAAEIFQLQAWSLVAGSIHGTVN